MTFPTVDNVAEPHPIPISTDPVTQQLIPATSLEVHAGLILLESDNSATQTRQGGTHNDSPLADMHQTDPGSSPTVDDTAFRGRSSAMQTDMALQGRRCCHPITYTPSKAVYTFHAYKRQRLFDGRVYIYYSTCPSSSSGTPNDVTEYTYNIFLAVRDKAQPELQPHLANATDNKHDTLTQSQMLKDTDHQKFVATQESEVNGLIKMDVFDILPIQTKPT
jgi:hypothetical protein